MTTQMQSRQNAEKMLHDFCEVIKYGSEEVALEWWQDPVKQAYRLVIGQYFQKGAAKEKIQFNEFCAALSTDFANGALQAVRALGKFPKYNLQKSRKFKIGKGCATPGTGFCYGYEEKIKS